MAMTDSESEAYLENITTTIETPNSFIPVQLETDFCTVRQGTDGILLTDTCDTAAGFESEKKVEVLPGKDVLPKFEDAEAASLVQQNVPTTSLPEREAMDMALQNEGEDEGFKGYESIDDIEIDTEQMLQIVNVISLCEQEDIINANHSQLDDIINADQSQLEDIITDQLDDITITEEQFQLDESITENNCMEMQQDLQCANLLDENAKFDQQKNITENQFTVAPSNSDQRKHEQNASQELHLFCQQGDSVTEDQTVAEANLRYGIPTVEYEVDHEESPVVEQMYVCTECRQRFVERDDLEQHLWDHIAAMTGKHPHRCPKCPGRTFPDMKEHKRHHRMGLECDVCGEAFHAAIILADHRIQAHTRSKVYSCKICKVTFTSRAELSQHKERHAKNRVYNCKMCNESFQSEVGLGVHMKTHSGSPKIRNIREKESPSNFSASKSHSCSHCGQYFVSIEILENHVKSEHSKVPENSVSCDVCQKSFLRPEDLKMHRATHSNLKLYKCEECEDSFAHKHLLKEHSQKHRDERKCQVCGYISSSSSRLVKHIKRNHREKLFECKRCVKWFYSKDDLSSHMEKEHKSAHKKEKSNSYNSSKHELKDSKTVLSKEIVDEDSRCVSSCATELSMEDHEVSSSPELHQPEDARSLLMTQGDTSSKLAENSNSRSPREERLFETASREPSPLSESSESHSFEPLRKKLKEDATSSPLVSTKEKSSESFKVKSEDDTKYKSLDYSKDRPKGEKKSDLESLKHKSRNSSQEKSKDDEKSSGNNVQLKGFKIPKIKKSKEAINKPEPSEQPTNQFVEDPILIIQRDLKDKCKEDKPSKWGERLPEEKKALPQETTKPLLNKMPLLATPPISKLPLLPTPVSNKIPLLATPNIPRQVKKSRWGEPLNEDTATVWSGPSRIQSTETNKFMNSESVTDKLVEHKSWHDSSKDKSKPFKKSRWGEPLKDAEVMMSSTSNENLVEDNRPKMNKPSVARTIEENKQRSSSKSPVQHMENSKARVNQPLTLPESNNFKSSVTLSARTVEGSRLKPNQMPAGRPVEESSRFKSNASHTGRHSHDAIDRPKSNAASSSNPVEDSRFKPNAAPIGRALEDNRSKSNSVSSNKPVVDSRFKPNAAPTRRPLEDNKSKSNSVSTDTVVEESTFKTNAVPIGKPSEDNRYASNPVSIVGPSEDFTFNVNVPPPGWPKEDTGSKTNLVSKRKLLEDKTAQLNGLPETDGYKLNPLPVARPLVNKIKLNLLPTLKPDENNRERNLLSASKPGSSSSSVGLSSKQQLELEYKKFEMLVQASTGKTLNNTEIEYKKFEMFVQASMAKAVSDAKSILHNPVKDKATEEKMSRWGETSESRSGTDSTLTSYKSLIGPVSENKKSVVKEPLQDDDKSMYTGSPMDMSIEDDSSNDKSVEEIIKDQEDEGLTWGASFLEENKLVWGKSFLEDQTTMLQEPLKEKKMEHEKAGLNKQSKNVSTTKSILECSTSTKEKEALSSKSFKHKLEDPTKTLFEAQADTAPPFPQNTSKEIPVESAQQELPDAVEVRPLEDPSMYWFNGSDENMDENFDENSDENTDETDKPSLESSSHDKTGLEYIPFPQGQWGESSSSKSNNVSYRDQHFQTNNQPTGTELQGHPTFDSFLDPRRRMKESSGLNSLQPEDSEENKGSNLSDLLEGWLKGNKTDEPLMSQKVMKSFVPSSGVSQNSHTMKQGDTLLKQPAIEPSTTERAVEDKKSNLSDLLEEWLKEHKK